MPNLASSCGTGQLKLARLFSVPSGMQGNRDFLVKPRTDSNPKSLLVPSWKGVVLLLL